MHSTGTIALWIGFSLFILFALSLDTWFLKKKPHYGPQSSSRASIIWTSIWIASALVFNLIFWIYLSHTTDSGTANKNALDFLTGYLIEKSLSIDNLFVFYMVFDQLKIPPAYQQRIFSYGIWGAIVFRLIMILLGSYLISRYHWIIYILGGFLMITGIKMFFLSETNKDLSSSLLFRILKRYLPLTDKIKGQAFFIKQDKLWLATPLFVGLIFIEVSDLIFAFDSIPAIFAITRDPFIVWSSNIFAILGLRALYFLLANMVEKFKLLKYGIAVILVFVGFKMLAEPWLNIPTIFSLGMIIGTLGSFIFASWRINSKSAASQVALSIAHYLKPRNKTIHKGNVGHLLIVGGDETYPGAPRLSAEAALRVGTGLVTVATHPTNVSTITAQHPEFISLALTSPDVLDVTYQHANVMVLGPGLGRTPWSEIIWQHLIDAEKPMIVDADALYWLALHPRKKDNWILTPHPGEAACLLNVSTETIQADRQAAVIALHQRYGGVIVLKGAGTLVFKGNHPPSVCTKGNPGMATAGMGDVLTGVIAGLVAQGIPLAAAAELGVNLHAEAGDMAAKEGERGMIATDLMPYLRRLANPG